MNRSRHAAVGLQRAIICSPGPERLDALLDPSREMNDLARHGLDARMHAITPLRPALASAVDLDLSNLDRVVAAAGARRLTGDALREALRAHAVSGLCARIGDDGTVLALSAVSEEDENAEGWVGAKHQAHSLGLHAFSSIVVLFLISERTTSGAAQSRYAQALAETAARRFGGASSIRDAAVGELLATHEGAFRRFLQAQRDLTVHLLHGRSEVTLSTAASRLRPRSSPARRIQSCGRVFVLHQRWLRNEPSAARCEAVGGNNIVLLSAVVPTDRVLATPATGAGAALEREIVLTVGDPADRVTFTPATMSERWVGSAEAPVEKCRSAAIAGDAVVSMSAVRRRGELGRLHR